MNLKTTLALLLLASIAGLWLWKGDDWGPKIGIKPDHPEPQKSVAEGTLDSLAPAAITRVEVALPSGDSFVIERAATETGWKLPGNWPPRKPEVEELVEMLGNLRTRFHAIPLEEVADLSQYGLAPDQKPLIVKVTANGQALTLTFGEPKPAARETAFTRPAYVRVNDAKEVLKLGPDVMPIVRRSADSYRRRSLFPDVERVKVAGAAPPSDPFGSPSAPGAPVTVTLPGEDTALIRVARSVPTVFNLDLAPAFTFTLVRTGKLPEPAITTKGGEPGISLDRLADAWALDAPVRDRAEPARLRSVLTNVADLWVDQFVPTADAKFASDSRFAVALLMPIPFESPLALAARAIPEAGFLDPLRDKVPVEDRTGLAKADQSVLVKRNGSEPVTVRFGGIAKIVERDEPLTVRNPMGMPTTINQKILTEYRFARVDGNPQVFMVNAEKLPDLFATARQLIDSQVARFSPDEAQEVAIRTTDRREVKLTRKKGNPKAEKPEEQKDQWLLDATPNPLLADSARVNELLGELSRFRMEGPEQRLYPKEAPAAETTVTVVTREKRPEGEPDAPARQFTLRLGKPDYVKRRLPVQLAGWPRVTLADDTLGPDDPDSWIGSLLFPKTISALITREPLAYRDRRLFDSAAELSAVGVAGGFTLKREGDWKLTAPIASEADPGKAGQLALTLANLGVTEYLTDTPTADELKEYGLEKPTHKVSLGFRDGRKYTLDLGAARPGKPEVFARLDNGAVFVLPNALVEQLTTGVVGLLPLRVWSAVPEKIKSLEIIRGDVSGESFTLTRDRTTWKLTSPFTALIPDANAKSLLGTFGNLNAVRYHALSVTNPAEFGFDKPLLTLKLTYTEQIPPATSETLVTKAVVVGGLTPDGAGRYARLDSPNAPVFVVPAAFAFVAQTPPLELLDRSLLSFEPARIAKVRVAPEKPEDAFTLAKDDKGKWSAEGITFAVDAERINRLTSTLAKLPVAVLAAYGDGVKWADYGLEKPEVALTITLGGERSEIHTIALGKADPLGGRYARVDDGKAVAVIPAIAAESLARKKFEYADRALLGLDEKTTVTGFTRKQGKDELELAPSATLGWDIIKPAKQKADQLFVDELADALVKLRAERVAAYGKKDELFKQFGLEPPAAAVSLVVSEKGEQKTLRIGNPVDVAKPDGDRYAAVESVNPEVIVGVLPAILAQKLLAPPVAFRDRTLAKFVDADKAVVERGDRKITFAKIGVTWKVTEPLATAAESAELEALIADLGKLRVDTWVGDIKDLKSFGLDKPEAKWTLFDGDKAVLVLLIGKKTADGRVHVATDKGELVGLLDPVLTSRVLAEYRQRKPWDVDVAQVASIEIVATGGKFTLEKDGPVWFDPAKATQPIDARVVNELLGTLGALRVERYVIDKGGDPKLFGLEKPEVTLTVMQGGAKRVLEIGGTVGGTDGKQRYARVAGKDRSDVFVLTAADTMRLTRDRAAYLMKK